MNYSVTEMPRPVRRRLKRTVHKSPDKYLKVTHLFNCEYSP